MIKLNNIHKEYENKVILDDFNLDVKEGEMLAVLGESGTGKSTLLNIIGLLEKPDSGDVIIGSTKNPRLNSTKSTLLRRNTIGYLFQNYALIDNMTVSKNLDVALEYVKPNNKEKQKLEVLKEVGLEDRLKSKIYQLSGGEQQRVAIARLMLKPCDIILADEPTGSLDVHNRDIVINLLQKLNENGKTVLIVTHDENVSKVCNRTISL